MAWYAVADDNDRVSYLWEEPDGVPVSDCFHPDFILTHMKKLTAAQADKVQAGWIFSTLKAAPVEDTQPTMEELYAVAASMRDGIRDAGTLVNGWNVRTDVVGYALVRGALDLLTEKGGTVDFSIGEGQTTKLDAGSIKAIYDAISAHIQSCFTAYAQACAAISAGEIKTVADLRDNVSWPANS